ncbi:tyrosine-type recombinase/integrase [Rhizobium sp. NTR19]|uniref:Tyrosine-type recombinase/integrase n=1 Tax=Neorhizobium turbinariae TaxID=2937795 RepID=A0ABT0IMJ8_9HYPH|nr:tyrosine-type recombinase/integrase [Neorhizobium turbinariae]MCK8779049.1 tyrosine-type recombinase/integrase [Neorhizobium turbinariae]
MTTPDQAYEASGMPRKLPLHVTKQKTRHDKWVFYFRIGKGKRIRLPYPNDPTFKAAYRAALTGSPVEVAKVYEGTLQWLWDRYTTESAKWAGYSPATQKQQRLIMAKVLEKNGHYALSTFTQDVIQEGVDKRHETPALAANFLKVMRGMFGWARKMRLVAADPTIGVEPPGYKSDGFPPWTIDDVRAFRQRHEIGTPERLAMELMLLTGLRRSDVAIAGRQHIKGKELSLATAKTGSRITVELTDDLLKMIEQTPRKGLHLIESSRGKPFVKEAFGNWFRERCTEAGVTKSAHGLRKLSATLAAEGGAGSHQLMAQYGWTKLATAEIYTKGVDRKRLGVEGSRIVADQIENILSPHPISGEGFKPKKAIKTKAKN